MEFREGANLNDPSRHVGYIINDDLDRVAFEAEISVISLVAFSGSLRRCLCRDDLFKGFECLNTRNTEQTASSGPFRFV